MNSASVIKKVWGPAQNAVYADTQGNIGYVMSARVPIRKKGHGEVPVPGDTDDYEWTGYIPFEQLAASAQSRQRADRDGERTRCRSGV